MKCTKDIGRIEALLRTRMFSIQEREKIIQLTNKNFDTIYNYQEQKFYTSKILFNSMYPISKNISEVVVKENFCI